jgi:hypothetical protein
VPGIRLERVVSGLEAPVQLTAPPGDPRLFIVEQAGRIRVARDGRLLERPYLDLSDSVGSGGERGLLSLAFHPRFAANGRLFVNYTDARGDTHIAEFRADPAADTVIRSSERLVLFADQPFANHNGGHVLFGPDGALYAGMGDGGAAGDPGNRAQDPAERLGKILRIAVDAAGTDAQGQGGTIGPVETWALGLRNPWRMAFDTVAGFLYVADVGQNRWEEINVVPAGERGVNYGWRRLEGSQCFLLPSCRRAGTQLPAMEYGHDQGCSVTGGLVYRGRAVPALVGHYLYSDFCGGWIRAFRWDGTRVVDHRTLVEGLGPVSSFGEDAAGEVYVVVLTGEVFRMAGPAAPR